MAVTRGGEAGVERSSHRRFQQLDRDVRPSLLSALGHLNGAVSSILEPGAADRAATGGAP